MILKFFLNEENTEKWLKNYLCYVISDFICLRWSSIECKLMRQDVLQFMRKTVGMTHRETYLSRELFLKLCLIISQSSRHDNVFPKSAGYGLSAKRTFWKEPKTTFRCLSDGITIHSDNILIKDYKMMNQD